MINSCKPLQSDVPKLKLSSLCFSVELNISCRCFTIKALEGREDSLEMINVKQMQEELHKQQQQQKQGGL